MILSSSLAGCVCVLFVFVLLGPLADYYTRMIALIFFSGLMPIVLAVFFGAISRLYQSTPNQPSGLTVCGNSIEFGSWKTSSTGLVVGSFYDLPIASTTMFDLGRI